MNSFEGERGFPSAHILKEKRMHWKGKGCHSLFLTSGGKGGGKMRPLAAIEGREKRNLFASE